MMSEQGGFAYRLRDLHRAAGRSHRAAPPPASGQGVREKLLCTPNKPVLMCATLKTAFGSLTILSMSPVGRNNVSYESKICNVLCASHQSCTAVRCRLDFREAGMQSTLACP